MYKFCVAAVNTTFGKPEVSFYAYRNDGYGLHRTSSWDDPNVLWYETEVEAKKNCWNANDCVLMRWMEV